MKLLWIADQMAEPIRDCDMESVATAHIRKAKITHAFSEETTTITFQSELMLHCLLYVAHKSNITPADITILDKKTGKSQNVDENYDVELANINLGDPNQYLRNWQLPRYIYNDDLNPDDFFDSI
jgi:hypothetical protein